MTTRRFCPKTVAGLLTLAAMIACFSCEVDDDAGSGSGSPSATLPPEYGNIPRSADRVADGYGRLWYRADRDCTVWVGNESRGYLVVSRRVNRGDEIEVIPDRNRVEVEGHAVYEQDMESGARHAIFASGSGSWDDGSQEPYGEIPRRARSMATGTGRIEWRAESPGRIWVGNDHDHRVVVAEDVRRGDMIEVIPNQNEVKINGRVIFNQNMESKRQHSIFYTDSLGGR